MFGQNDPRYPLPDLDVLLVEDAASLRAIYEPHLRRAGLGTYCAASTTDALSLFQRHRMKLVLIDLSLQDRSGFDLLADILALQPETSVVLLAAEHSTEQAVQAVRAGALDFLVKPISEERLTEVIEIARQLALQRTNRDNQAGGAPLGEFIGRSPRMQQVYGHMRAAARSQAPLLISGEIGTGKKLAAQCIHALSARGTDGFVALDCASLTPELLEETVLATSRQEHAPPRRDAVSGQYRRDEHPDPVAPARYHAKPWRRQTGLPSGVADFSSVATPTALVTEGRPAP
ncbi:MAG: response regulator [Paracoccaceae bacterium]